MADRPEGVPDTSLPGVTGRWGGAGGVRLKPTSRSISHSLLARTPPSWTLRSLRALSPKGDRSSTSCKQSERFATELGQRLRQRVYIEVIPALAVAVAKELERKVPDRADDLDLAYRLTLRILFRLLFQAYAEDRGLLPYGRNPRYDRNALKTWALDLTADPEMDFDPESQSMWDDLTQVWRVIDNGDRAWERTRIRRWTLWQ